MTRPAMTILLLAVLLPVGGCGSPAEQKAQLPAKMVMLDARLPSQVQVERQSADRVQGNLLRVRTMLRNTGGKDLWVDVQVAWKDAGGFELYKTNWAPLHLAPQVVTQHEAVSMRADASDYEMRIRRPENAKN